MGELKVSCLLPYYSLDHAPLLIYSRSMSSVICDVFSLCVCCLIEGLIFFYVNVNVCGCVSSIICTLVCVLRLCDV